jgi:pyrimidine operon attenuation protein / uracil phosphoribosyltransferase
MQVLNHYQITHKISRLAYEILENNLEEKEIYIIGINKNGSKLASLIFDVLVNISNHKVILENIKLNPANPLEYLPELTTNHSNLQDKVVIMVDDVANTGRTIFYAFKTLMDVVPKKIEVAVLVDRKHKTFPVKVDYVGLSLATTIQENIKADLNTTAALAVLVE